MRKLALSAVTFRKTIILLLVLFGYCTYISQNIIGLNEYVAEGLPLLLGFIYLACVTSSLRLNGISAIMATYLIILYIITTIDIIKNDDTFLRYIFIYSYLPVFYIVSYNKKIRQDAQYIMKTIAYFGILCAIIGISQYLNLQNIIPIDINRARGMSRSTLNYSSLMFLAYIAADFVFRGNKPQLKFIILIGALFSLSRGAVMAILIYEIIKNINSKSKTIAIAITIIIFYFTMVLIVNSEYIFPENIKIMADKYVYALSIVNDPGNVERVISYSRVIDEWSMIGHGFGSTGPAAQRFNENSSGFESFILGLAYQGGLSFVIFVPIIIIMIYFRNKNLWERKITGVVLAYATMMLVQQTFETPSVNIIAWMVLISIVHFEWSKAIKNVGYKGKNFECDTKL